MMKEISKKEQVVNLLKPMEIKNSKAVGVINPEKYVQHNLGVKDGLAGFGELMHFAVENGIKIKVNTIRVFEDENFVFAQTDYDFFGPKVGFDVFRFENGKIVEHWDVIEEIPLKDKWANDNGKF